MEVSTFVVFGMTKSKAKELADKLVTKEAMSFEQKVEKVLGGNLTKPISEPFDAPQFAKEYLELAKRTDGGCRLSIKVKKEVGLTKTGKPRMKWVEWEAA